MANNLNLDLKDKKVRIRGNKKIFLCRDGFGCSPLTNGSSIYGVYIDDIRHDKNGKEIWECITGYIVESIVE